jgi:ribosomal protein S18 acetylase RimI-like enzyme
VSDTDSALLAGWSTPAAQDDPSALPASIPAALRSEAGVLAFTIEQASLNSSQPAEQAFHDGWLLRFSPGKAKRARSVQPLMAGTLPLEDKISHVRRFYEARGLTPIIRITPMVQPAHLDDTLAALGWRAFEDCRVMQRTLDPRLPVFDEAEAASRGLKLVEMNVAEFTRLIGGWRGSSATAIAAHAARLNAQPFASRMLALFDGHGPAAVGQFVLEAEGAGPTVGGVVGVFDIFTAAEVRGQGHARRLTAALLDHATLAGARRAYLQVDAHNVAARAVYSALGFTDLYAYWYRAPGAILQP